MKLTGQNTGQNRHFVRIYRGFIESGESRSLPGFIAKA